MTHDELIERVAVAISGAPFSSIKSRSKARMIISLIADCLDDPTSSAVASGINYRMFTTIGGENTWHEDTENLFRIMIRESQLYSNE